MAKSLEAMKRLSQKVGNEKLEQEIDRLLQEIKDSQNNLEEKDETLLKGIQAYEDEKEIIERLLQVIEGNKKQSCLEAIDKLIQEIMQYRNQNKKDEKESAKANVFIEIPDESTPLLPAKAAAKSIGKENKKLTIGASELATPIEVLTAGLVALGISLPLGIKEIKELSDYLDAKNDGKIFVQGALGAASFGAIGFLFFLGEAYHKWSKDDEIKEKSIIAFFNNEDYGREVLKKAGRTVLAGGTIFETFLFSSPLITYGMEALGQLLKATTAGQIALNATGTLVLAAALTGVFYGIVKKLGGDPTLIKLFQIGISLFGFGMGGTAVKAIISAENLDEVAAKIITTVGIPAIAATPTVIPLVPSAVASTFNIARKGVSYGWNSFFKSDNSNINQAKDEEISNSLLITPAQN